MYYTCSLQIDRLRLLFITRRCAERDSQGLTLWVQPRHSRESTLIACRSAVYPLSSGEPLLHPPSPGNIHLHLNFNGKKPWRDGVEGLERAKRGTSLDKGCLLSRDWLKNALPFTFYLRITLEAYPDHRWVCYWQVTAWAENIRLSSCCRNTLFEV